METPQIVAYLKTQCGWSNGARAVFSKYNLPYQQKDIIQNPPFRCETEQKSGQPRAPCVEINDVMLAAISGEEETQYQPEHNMLTGTRHPTESPINTHPP